MDEISKQAAKEVINVLYNTEISLIAKIPYSIIKILEEKAIEYKDEIKLDMSLNLFEQQISEEAQTILAIIYKDFWCDKEKQSEMNKIIEEKEAEYDKELEEKYNPFKKIYNQESQKENLEIIKENKNEDSEKALIKFNKKWYLRIFEKVIRFFRKK